MPERVTVAVDGGRASEAALAWAIDRARSVDLSMTITTVVGPDSELPPGAQGAFMSRSEDVLMRAKATTIAELPTLAVTTQIRRGQPHDAIIAASGHADLLVIGTNKTPPLTGIIHGTLPLKVAGQAECTTVVVPVDWKPETGEVVVGWNDDAAAEKAVDFAAAEASRRDVGLTIVHAWKVPGMAPMDGAGAAILVEQVMNASRQLLAEAAHRVELAYPTLPVTQSLHAGQAAVALVGAASHASLVVVGSRGRGAITGFFLGSVSHDVLLNMPAPVAVVPKAEEPVDVYPDFADEEL
jgi:nucleotide-binding universal stress UspA family protein